MSDGEFQVPKYPSEWIDSVKTKPMTGIEKIAQERLEQKIKHGRSIRSDYELNPDFELSDMAAALLTENYCRIPLHWNKEIVNKMMDKSYEERLIIAGALIAAEIDRLNFKE